MGHFVRCVGLVSVVLLFAGEAMKAQGFSVPVSNDVVEGTLTIPGSATIDAHFEAREGSMVTVHSKEGGYRYGVIPVIDEDGGVLFFVFEIQERNDGGQEIRQILAGDGKAVSARCATGAAETVLVQGTPFGVRVEKIRTENFKIAPKASPLGKSRPAELAVNFGVPSGLICEISCYGVSVSATGVSLATAGSKCGQCESGAYSLKR